MKVFGKIFSKNPNVKFIGPSPVRKLLDIWGIPKKSIINPKNVEDAGLNFWRVGDGLI